MNELKPEDVMRALEVMSASGVYASPNFQRNILTLLREKDAEIERLTKELDGQFEKWKILADKTEEHYEALYQDAKQAVRAEAIDEFSERLKQKMLDMTDGYVSAVVLVNQTAKELKGEKE